MNPNRSGIDIGQCTVASRMKVIARDKTMSFETTYSPPKGKEMVLMLIGLADKGCPTRDIDPEQLLQKMGLVRAGEGKEWHAELQKIGYRLGLPAGSNILEDILPAIDKLLEHKKAHLEFSEKMEWARPLAKPKELGMHLADVAKARYDEATAVDRAEFEAYHRKFCEKRGLDPSDIDSEFQRNDEGEYIYAMACDGWEVWCAARGKAAIPTAPFPPALKDEISEEGD